MKDSEISLAAELKKPGSEKNSLDNKIIDLLTDCHGPKTCRLLSALSTPPENEDQNIGKSAH
ncbi:MAG: hypothetical protein V1897_05355 [Pseudomonadota bacterium]